MATTKFLQVLEVEDYRIESGVEALPGEGGVVDLVKIWLHGSPATPFSKVTGAFLCARSDYTTPPLPSYDFLRKRIVIAYTPATIQPVVSLLLDGVQVYCLFRELEGGGVRADVHLPRHKPQGGAEPGNWYPGPED